VADALELLQPIRGALMPVPAVQTGICRICHSSTNPGYLTCYQCGFDAVSVGATEVVPITMSVDRELVHHHLRGYKDGRSEEERARLTTRLAALLAVFLDHHARCLGPWDYATCVPSETRSAVAKVAERTRRLHGSTRAVLKATPGDWSRQFTTERFSVANSVTGDRVLLLEDTYASGSAVHSAAAVLRAAGAHVVGPLVLGRHVSPGHPPSALMLEWLRGRRWEPTRCCRCAGEVRDAGALPI
jgi:hypothetical protein